MDIWTKIVAINIGRIERWARVLVGLCLLIAVSAVPTRWGLLGIYPLLTGMAGTSPLYTVLGFQTTPKRAPAKPPRPLPPITRSDAP